MTDPAMEDRADVIVNYIALKIEYELAGLEEHPDGQRVTPSNALRHALEESEHNLRRVFTSGATGIIL